MAELGVGYVSILPEVSKISPNVAKALQGLDPVAEGSGKSMGGKLSSAIGTTLKASVAGAGLAAGGVIAAGLTKGLGRLTGIENAQASLRGLGHDAGSVQTIMDDALASVSGTAFGLETAAGVAASAVAAGITPGEELERTLKMVGDAATIAGIDMGAMGSIVNKVATSDMMQMDVANQLMDAGIPILQMVADEMGVTAEEARKMASDGKVSFETFQTALENGVGGAALEAGDTFQGALANMGAALGRTGATVLEPFFDLSKQGFGVVTESLDNVNARLKPLAADTAEWLQGTAVPGLKSFAENAKEAWASFQGSSTIQGLMANTGVAVSDLVSTGRELAPVMGQAASAIGQATAALGVSSWQLAIVGLEGIGAAARIAVPPLEMITGFMQDHPGVVTAAVAAYAGFKTIPTLLSKITSVTAPMRSTTSEWGASVSDLKAYYEGTGRSISTFDAIAQSAGMSSNAVLADMGKKLNNASVQGGALARTTGVLSAGFTGIKGAAGGVVTALGGPLGVALAGAGIAIGAVVQSNQRAEAAQDAMAEAARGSASAQIELKSAVAGTTGALNEQAKAAATEVVRNDLAETIELAKQIDGYVNVLTAPDLSFWKQGRHSSEWREYRDQVQQSKDEFDAIQSVIKEAEISMDEFYAVVAAGGPEYDDLINRLRNTEGGGAEAAAGLEKVRGKLDQVIEEARLLDPAIQQGAAAIDILANAAGDADTRLGGLRKLMQAMGFAPKDAEEAMKDASAAIREVVEAAGSLADPTDAMGESLLGASGEIDTTTKNGEALFNQLKGLGEELMNVASNGGDVDGKLREMQPALQTLADEFDLPIEKIQELSRGFGLVPRELRVGVALDGAEGVTQELGDVWQAVEHLQVGGEPIKVQVESEEAKLAIEEAGFALEKIEGTESSFWINAETEGAQGELADVILKMGEIDHLEVNPEVFLNDRELITSANNAQGILAALDIQDPSPEASLIIQDLLNGVNISQAELDFLSAQSSEPIADIQTALLEAGVKLSNDMLEALHERPTKPVIDADSKPLVDQAARARAELDKLPKEVITKLRIQEWREYYTTVGTSTGGGVANHSAPVGNLYPPARGATGGRFDPRDGFSDLPGYYLGGRHGGYRLPSTGPGTDRVDGFLAMDSSGIPVAHLDKDEWVVNGRSSEKYDRAIAMINRDDPSVQHLARLETGGRVGRPADQILAFADGQRVDGEQASRSLQGALYDWAGINWGDCSAAMAGLSRFATGAAPFAARFSTANQDSALAALGFQPGLGNPAKDFSIGWLNGGIGGGHTSGTIAGVNVEMGGGAGGNGKIGGGAAPANHPQYTNHRHLPLAGVGRNGEILSQVMSTSTSGITLERGETVDWGEARGFYDQALGYLQKTKVFDTGGILGTGQFAFNAGPPERILPANLTRSFDQFVAMAPGIVGALQSGDTSKAQAQLQVAADTMLEAAELDIESSRQQVQDAGRNLGGDWVGQAQIVRDAEQGLADLRKQLNIETINIRRSEEGLEEARKSLREAEAEGGALSESTKRKLEDAENSLRKAREGGKADKIADAEKRLSRVREDAAKETSDTVRKALEEVSKAEETLAEQREKNEDAALRLEAAERAIAAARYQALADMTSGIFSALGSGVIRLGAFFDEMGRLAGIVEKTRQEVSKLEMQQISNQNTLLKAQHDLRVAEWDLQRTRAQGAINLVMAEQNVSDARAQAALMGETGIEAMSGAMDRYRETGEFSIGQISEAEIERSQVVQEALWGVRIVEAQNALDALNASHTQSQAQFAVAQATLTSVQTAELLQLQTAALEGQARQLYGLTQNQAQGASKGMGGLGGLLGGIGKIGGGILTGLAGFATGGPLGAIPGAIMAIGGLGETVKGGVDAWNNRDEIGQAWGKMGGLEKVGLVGGGLLSGAATIGGAYLGGPEGAVLGAELGEVILDTTVGSWQHSISSTMEKQNRDYADRLQQMQMGHGQKSASMEEERLLAQLKYLEERDRAEADVAYAELMKQVAASNSDELTDKLLEAAEIEASRAGRASDAQLVELKRSGDALDELVELFREQSEGQATDDGIAGSVAQAVGKLIGTLTRPGLSAVSADQYMNSHL